MNTVAVTHDSKSIAMIELSLIQESPDNPRQTYDKAALDELSKSIASKVSTFRFCSASLKGSSVTS